MVNKKTQYQIELQAVEDKGGDVEAFKKSWHKRAVSAYRRNVNTEADITKFRRGGFII